MLLLLLNDDEMMNEWLLILELWNYSLFRAKRETRYTVCQLTNDFNNTEMYLQLHFACAIPKPLICRLMEMDGGGGADGWMERESAEWIAVVGTLQRWMYLYRGIYLFVQSTEIE